MQSRTRRTGFSRRSIHVRRRSRYLSCLGDCYVGLVMVLSYVGLGTKLHEAGRSQARSLSLPKRAKKRCSFRLFFWSIGKLFKGCAWVIGRNPDVGDIDCFRGSDTIWSYFNISLFRTFWISELVIYLWGIFNADFKWNPREKNPPSDDHLDLAIDFLVALELG
jgi:hypothetical protein